MPVDQKRINGPEVSMPYDTYVKPSLTNDYKRSAVLQQRSDDRKNNERRKIFLKTGIVTQAKGSAYIEMGNTKVICSVFDPREIPNKTGYCVRGELFCEFKFAPFSCGKRRNHQQDTEEKEYSLILQRALEPAVCLHEFPNFQIDVYATVLDNGGSCLAAAITVASLALANAGVSMFGLVTASTIGVRGDTHLLDPTDIEEQYCNICEKSEDYGIITQASLPQHGQISEFFLIGDMTIKCINKAIDSLKAANKDVCPLMQECLVKSIFKAFNERNSDDVE